MTRYPAGEGWVVELAGKTGLSERSIEAGRIARPRPGTVRLLADAFALCGTQRDSFHQSALADPGIGPAVADEADEAYLVPIDQSLKLPTRVHEVSQPASAFVAFRCDCHVRP